MATTNKPVSNWAKLPSDLILGNVAGVAVDDRDRVYLFNRGNHPLVVLSQRGAHINMGRGCSQQSAWRLYRVRSVYLFDR